MFWLFLYTFFNNVTCCLWLQLKLSQPLPAKQLQRLQPGELRAGQPFNQRLQVSKTPYISRFIMRFHSRRNACGVWKHWWDLVILTHVYLSHAHPAAVNSQPKLRHRRSCSRPSRTWRCTCRRKRGARESPAPSTRSSMRCDVSNRWKVRLASVTSFLIFVHSCIHICCYCCYIMLTTVALANKLTFSSIIKIFVEIDLRNQLWIIFFNFCVNIARKFSYDYEMKHDT